MFSLNLKSVLIAIAITQFAFLAFTSCSRATKSLEEKRETMVREYVERRGIRDPKILNAFRQVPRESFVLPQYRDRAYEDAEIPIAFGETLNRPYEDAIMLDALSIEPHHRVLEIGTGTGYQTALMSRIGKEVYTIEIVPEYADRARRNFEDLNFTNIRVKTGDGFLGWPEYAPFDSIIMMCSPPSIPEPLKDQLAENGVILLPLGGAEKFQELVLYKKTNGVLTKVKSIAPATFSPMKGKILEKEVR